VIRAIEATDGGAAIQVLEGRYGPYVTDGEINASIPRGTDPAAVTLEEARGLIEARRGAPPRPGGRRRGRATAAAPKRRKVRADVPAEKVAAAGASPRLRTKRKSASRKTIH
jgi:DNA topoisomerase-1